MTTNEDFQVNPNLLSTPMLNWPVKMFEDILPIPMCSGKSMKFTCPTKQEKIRCHTEYVNRLKESLRDALNNLEKVENE